MSPETWKSASMFALLVPSQMGFYEYLFSEIPEVMSVVNPALRDFWDLY